MIRKTSGGSRWGLALQNKILLKHQEEVALQNKIFNGNWGLKEQLIF